MNFYVTNPGQRLRFYGKNRKRFYVGILRKIKCKIKCKNEKGNRKMKQTYSGGPTSGSTLKPRTLKKLPGARSTTLGVSTVIP